MYTFTARSTVTTHQRLLQSSLPARNTAAVAPTSTPLHRHWRSACRDVLRSPHGETLKRNSWRAAGKWMTCMPPLPHTPQLLPEFLQHNTVSSTSYQLPRRWSDWEKQWRKWKFPENRVCSSSSFPLIFYYSSSSSILLRLLFFFFLHCYFLGLGPEASSTQLADTTGQPHHKATNTVPLQHKIEKTQTSIFWTWFEPV